jgi:formylglycine-generating enzyme required for sulfatase activity
VFDLHSAENPMTLSGQFLGSLPWASPEQAQGNLDKIDTRTDVYSLGVILYQLLTGGQFPYEVAGTMRDVLNNIVTADPTPPSRVLAARQAKEQRLRRVRRSAPSAVNEVIEAIVLKALSKRRDDRYQTAGELAREVESYLAGQPTIAGGQRILNRRSRLRVQIAATCAALTLVGAFTWGLAPHFTHRAARQNAVVDSESIPAMVTTTNTLGMKLVRIRPGTFQMGSPSDEAGRDTGETQHRVTLSKGFFMGATPITVNQFAVFANDAKYETEAEKQGTAFGWSHRDKSLNGEHRGVCWRNPGFPQKGNEPVVDVSWNDATAFCRWLSTKENRRYRLPTEAEWEYACRAGTQTAYYFGDAGKLLDYASCEGLEGDQPYPVGTKKPNAWGLYDMVGNVFQWCGDGYLTYTESPVTDPRGPADGPRYGLRGHGWYSYPAFLRSASRWMPPGALPSERRDCWGFRIVMELDN